MSNLNSWEDDPSAQDENLSRQAQQQLNMNPGNAPSFQPGAQSFQPGAQSFQPGQYGGGFQPNYQQQQYYQQGGYYGQQYGGAPQQQFSQYGQQYGGGFSQGYNQQQGYGMVTVVSLKIEIAADLSQVVATLNTASSNSSNNNSSPTSQQSRSAPQTVLPRLAPRLP